jgi:hypothetical protein
MTHDVALPCASTGLLGAGPARRALSPVALASIGVAILCGVVAVAAWSMTGSWGRSPQAAAPAQAEAAPGSLPATSGKARARSRCDSCGVVEIIRRFESAGKSPAGYEFTVRLRDGTTRVSSDASPARWRIGDTVMLIGGAKPPAD